VKRNSLFSLKYVMRRIHACPVMMRRSLLSYQMALAMENQV
jgi:hypothetical protein